MSHLLSVLVPFATSPSPSPSGIAPPDDTVSPGWLGFAFLAFLAIAVFVIWKSMNTQLKRVTFDEDAVNEARPSSGGDTDSEIAHTDDATADPAPSA